MNNQYKQKYLDIKISYFKKTRQFTQNGGAIYNNKNNNKTYSGSGIILVDKYNNNKGRNELAIILFKSQRNNMIYYEDLGGGIDNDDLIHENPLIITASREAYEESRGLISIKPHHIKSKIDDKSIFVDIRARNHNYRGYVIGLPPNTFLIEDYIFNKKVTENNNKIKNNMKETHDVTRFYMKDLLKDELLNNKQLIAKDVNNNEFMIFDRSKKIIRKAYEQGIFNLVMEHSREFIKLRNLISI